MGKPNSPCQGCINRCPNCHSICEYYITYKNQLDNFNETAYKARRKQYSLDRYQKESIIRAKKK